MFTWVLFSSNLWQSIIYFLLTIGLELLPFRKFTSVTIKQCWKNVRNLQHSTLSGDLEPLIKSPSETVSLNFDEDVDVQTERNRVLEGCVDNAVIYLRNLRKVLPVLVLLIICLYVMMTTAIQCCTVVIFVAHFRYTLQKNKMQKLLWIHWLSQLKQENVLAF